MAEVRHQVLEPEQVRVRLAGADSAWIVLAPPGRVGPPKLAPEREAQLAVLELARARWQLLRPRAFRITSHRGCFCVPLVVTQETRGDVTVTLGDGSPPYPVHVGDAVETLFGQVESEIRSSTRRLVSAEYDVALGYPHRFRSELPNVKDTWFEMTVDRFEILVPRRP